MARLGFNIGRALNKGVKFAAGAGAFDSIGKGSDLADTGKDLLGLSSNAQSTSLSDRIRGGLSSVSPEFARAENLRSAADFRNTQGALNTAQLNKVRADQAITPIDTFTANLGPKAKAAFLERVAQEGLLETEGDVSGLRKGVARDRLQSFTDEPRERMELARLMIEDTTDSIAKIESAKSRSIDDLVKKEMTAQGNKPIPGVSFTEVEKGIRSNIEQGLIPFPEGQGFDAEIEALNKKLTGFQSGLQSEIDAQSTPLQDSQKALNEAKVDKIRQELTQVGLPQAALGDVLKAKTNFEKAPGIIDYKKVQTQFDVMDNLVQRIAQGDIKNGGPTDVGLITMFNKIIDPDSVVRESEYDRLGALAPVMEKWRVRMKRITEGGALTPALREEILDTARTMRKSYDKFAVRAASDAIGFANDFGIKPSHIIGEELEGKVEAADIKRRKSEEFLRGGS